MEKNKKLLKDAGPGEVTLRGSITKPDVVGPPAKPQEPLDTTMAREIAGVKSNTKPPRKPFSDR